jgi:hypothetical protein
MAIHKQILLTVATMGLAGICSTGWAAGAVSTDTPGASAALDFRVVIPTVMRILDNAHPADLPPPDRDTARIAVQQRMVLMSTLPRGFCMDLHLGQQTLSDWQLQLSGTPGAWLQASGSGYRLCTGRPGRYDVALNHDFKASNAAEPTRGWPVQVSFTAP